jgi:hypothetical protein
MSVVRRPAAVDPVTSTSGAVTASDCPACERGRAGAALETASAGVAKAVCRRRRLPPLAGLGGIRRDAELPAVPCTYGQLIAGFQVANPPSGFSTHA